MPRKRKHTKLAPKSKTFFGKRVIIKPRKKRRNLSYAEQLRRIKKFIPAPFRAKKHFTGQQKRWITFKWRGRNRTTVTESGEKITRRVGGFRRHADKHHIKVTPKQRKNLPKTLVGTKDGVLIQKRAKGERFTIDKDGRAITRHVGKFVFRTAFVTPAELADLCSDADTNLEAAKIFKERAGKFPPPSAVFRAEYDNTFSKEYEDIDLLMQYLCSESTDDSKTHFVGITAVYKITRKKRKKARREKK